MSKDPEDYDFDIEKDIRPIKPWERSTQTFNVNPDSFGGEDFPEWKGGPWSEPVKRTIITSPKDVNAPIVTPEEETTIKKFLDNNPQIGYYKSDSPPDGGAWIQTYSGRRFNPLNPYVNAIVIQDIAHSLSMQCRFSGHVKKFYSVAQHCVSVSYICDSADALWGLLHDASEAYLVDIPRPLKHSGKFNAYLEFEDKMQKAICKRFSLPEIEPDSVKKADKILLATEARDLMSPLHKDWQQPEEPLPFKIDPLPQQEAKDLFVKRFYQLINSPNGYQHYLTHEPRG